MFCLHTDKKYNISWHHEKIIKALERVERGEIDRLLITVPPRHGKSELASIKFPAWYLGRNPDKQVITASYSGELAISFGRQVRNLVDETDYKSIFPVTLADDSKSAGIWHTSEGGSYVAAGVGGAITGKGAHIFIIDDPFKHREEAESETIRDKVYDWYTSVAYTRLEENGAIILIQTRWHEDDLAGRLLAKGTDNWEHLDLPAVSSEYNKKGKAPQALWPEKYSLDKLERIRANIGPYDWSALYMQQPISKESREFKSEWLKYFDKLEGGKNFEIFLTVDPAISKRDKACNSALVVCGVDAEFDIYVLEVVAKKLDPSELIEEIWRLQTKWDCGIVGIETIAYQQAISHYLLKKMEDEKKWLNIVEIRSSGDKEGRIRRLVPFFSNGKIFMKREQTDLEHELLNFPGGKNVDIIDALSMQLEIMYKPDRPKIKKGIPYEDDKDAPWNKKDINFSYKKLYSV